MTFHFHKYHGAGKDFVLLDNRDGEYDLIDKHDIFLLCDRHFGVGADGVIILCTHPDADFEMINYYPDGNKGVMSGNGGRCAVAFAKYLGIISGTKSSFIAADGLYQAKVLEENQIEITMADITDVEFGYDSAVFNMGHPHCVKFTEYLGDADMVKEGKKLRDTEKFKETGVSLSYLEYGTQALEVRTYEKGVEDEVLSSSAGAIACALVVSGNQCRHYDVPVKMKGGDLKVSFDKVSQQHYEHIHLSGLAEKVFEGEIEMNTKWKQRVALYDKVVGLKT